MKRGGKRPKTASEKTQRRNNRREELSHEHIRDIKEAFDLFDSSGTGTIEGKELRVALRALGFDPSKDEIEAILGGVAHTGRVDFHEFLDIIVDKVSEPDTDEDIARAFHMLDPDNTGYISIGNLQKVISELGEEMTHEEIEKMIRVAQSGSKEKKAQRKLEVNFEEFKAIMTKTD